MLQKNTEILKFINRFRKNTGMKEPEQNVMTPADFTFREQYSGCFASMLQKAFPGGTVLWEVPEPRAVYAYNGKLYDVTGSIKPKDTFYLELKWAPGSIIDALDGKIVPAPRPLDIMNAVNRFRQTMQKYIAMVNSEYCEPVSKNRMKEIVRAQLCHGTDYLEDSLIPMLYKTCINPYTRNLTETFMVNALAGIATDSTGMIPWYTPLQKDATDKEVITGPDGKEAIASILYDFRGNTKCIITTCDNHGSVSASIEIIQKNRGFAWNILPQNGGIINSDSVPEGEKWKKLALKLLAENLIADYGKPAFTFCIRENQSADQTATEEWLKACDATETVQKEESVESYRHVYNFDADRFLNWLGIDEAAERKQS